MVKITTKKSTNKLIVPNLKFKFSNGIEFDSHPLDWLNKKISDKRNTQTDRQTDR